MFHILPSLRRKIESLVLSKKKATNYLLQKPFNQLMDNLEISFTADIVQLYYYEW